jgi:uridine kinase
MSHLIALGGGSGSGKSLLSAALKQHLGDAASILPYDAYDRDQSHLSMAERDALNYDSPSAMDEELFIAHLKAIKRGETIAVPQFDFATHTRKKETTPFTPTSIVIVEGILAYVIPEPRKYFDYFIYVDAPADIRLARRIIRDRKERGYDTDHILKQYLSTVRPMHERYVEPTRKEADFLFPNPTNGGLDEKELNRLLTILSDKFLKKD